MKKTNDVKIAREWYEKELTQVQDAIMEKFSKGGTVSPEVWVLMHIARILILLTMFTIDIKTYENWSQE